MPTLLEREDELRRIDEALARARQGAGSLVLIEGPGGIGKTELLDVARDRAAQAGMQVAHARASELERELPFGVVRQLLEPLAMAAPAEEVFTGAAEEAARVLGTRVTEDPASTEDPAFAVLHGLFWLCSNLAAQRPLALAVDDAQWADLASLRFLAYLAQRREGLALALLLAARPAETPAEEEFLVRLASDPRAVSLAPAALSPGAVGAVVESVLGAAPDPGFGAACHAATGGTPFLVRELARELAAAEIEPVAKAAARVGVLAPRTVARSVAARIRRLGPGALELARAAAVLGAGAEPRLAAGLAGLDPGRAEELLDGLASAGIVRAERPVEFAHPIVRAAVYSEIPAGERSRLHLVAARRLAREDAAEDRVAAHVMATHPAGDHGNVDLLERAARAALARGAPASAAAYLERAVAEPPPPARRAELLHRLGVAQTRAGRPQDAARSLEDARAGAAAGPAAQIARDLVGPLMGLGRRAEAAAGLEQALAAEDLDGDLRLAIRAELLLIGLLEPAIFPDVGERLKPDESEAAGATAGAREYLAALTTWAGIGRGPAAEVRRLARRAADAGIVEELGAGAIGWPNVVYPLVAAEGLELADTMVHEAFEHLGRRASVVGSARAHSARAFLALRRGAVRAALADARTAVDVGREGGFQGWPIALSTLLEAHVEHGDIEAADAALAEAGLAGEIPDTFMTNWTLFARGRLRLAQGRVDDAVADLGELTRRADERGQTNPALVPQRSALAEACLRAGDRGRALRVAREELQLARAWDSPRAVGVALRACGLAEGGGTGLALLRESVEALAASQARLELARSQVELGAALRRAGERVQSREPLHAGMELAHACGAPPLVDRAREELLATGARPRRIMRSGVDALTPSELRVARQAADGMTNREIAQALFVTQRTVETHLTQVFRKLDIGSRDELAGALG